MSGGAAIFEQLERIPAREVPACQLVARLGQIRELRHRLDVLEAATITALEAGNPANGRAVVDAEFRRLDDHAGRRRADAAEAVQSMPAARAAFEQCELSVRHVQILASARTLCSEQFAIDEAMLVRKAEGRSVRSFCRVIRHWKMQHAPEAFATAQPEVGLSITERADGLHQIEGLLDTISAHIVNKALRDMLDAQWLAEHPGRRESKEPLAPFAQRLLVALVAVADRSLGGGAPASNAARYSAAVLIDYETMRGRLHDHGVCTTDNGEPLPPEVVRKLACNADLYPVVLGGDGVPLDMGRSRRLFTAAQRKALRALDTECMLDGCLPARYCEAHHNEDWFDGGLTDVRHGCMLADPCHGIVHRMGLTIRREGGYVVFYRPDGTLYKKTKHNEIAASRDSAACA